jgi:hypothetical protein
VVRNSGRDVRGRPLEQDAEPAGKRHAALGPKPAPHAGDVALTLVLSPSKGPP